MKPFLSLLLCSLLFMATLSVSSAPPKHRVAHLESKTMNVDAMAAILVQKAHCFSTHMHPATPGITAGVMENVRFYHYNFRLAPMHFKKEHAYFICAIQKLPTVQRSFYLRKPPIYTPLEKSGNSNTSTTAA
jgi:hypothetical protein